MTDKERVRLLALLDRFKEDGATHVVINFSGCCDCQVVDGYVLNCNREKAEFWTRLEPKTRFEILAHLLEPHVHLKDGQATLVDFDLAQASSRVAIRRSRNEYFCCRTPVALGDFELESLDP